MTKLLDELESLVSTFNASGVEFALCGGLALALHGCERATHDIDILILPGQLEEALRASASNGYDIRGSDLSFKDGSVESRRVSKADSDGDLTSVDFILVTPAMSKVWEDRESFDLNGISLWAVSREGLITMKRIAGRTQDLADIERLEKHES